MNAKQAVQQSEILVRELLDSAKRMAKRTGKSVESCINHKVSYYKQKATSFTEHISWDIRGKVANEIYSIENLNNKD